MEHTYDLHVHTANVSFCGHIPAKDVVQLYSKIGYHGVVITDHYFDGFFTRYTNLSWKDKVKEYVNGYIEAKYQGEELGLDVFLGMELRFIDNPNDYLVYGVTYEFLVDYPELYNLGLPGLKKLAAANDLLIYQAHPFRRNNYLTEVDLLDGIEVFNGNPRHSSYNEQAYAFAQKHQLKMISGSDFHQKEDLGAGGVVFTERVKNNQHLVSLLRHRRIEGLRGIKNIDG